MSIQKIKEGFTDSASVLNQFIQNEENWVNIEKAGMMMVDALKNGNKLLSCGNGGSMSDAMHFAEELTGRFRQNRRALAAIAIADPTHITCVANDYGFDYIFSRYVEAVGNEGDILLAISTSGNSKNILLAVEEAHKKGMKVIALTGKDGGKLKDVADVELRVPFMGFSDRIQEIHIKIIHNLIHFIELEMNLD